MGGIGKPGKPNSTRFHWFPPISTGFHTLFKKFCETMNLISPHKLAVLAYGQRATVRVANIQYSTPNAQRAFNWRRLSGLIRSNPTKEIYEMDTARPKRGPDERGLPLARQLRWGWKRPFSGRRGGLPNQKNCRLRLTGKVRSVEMIEHSFLV